MQLLNYYSERKDAAERYSAIRRGKKNNKKINPTTRKLQRENITGTDIFSVKWKAEKQRNYFDYVSFRFHVYEEKQFGREESQAGWELIGRAKH